MKKVFRFIYLAIAPILLFSLSYFGGLSGRYDYNKSLIVNSSSALQENRDRYFAEINTENPYLKNWEYTKIYNENFYNNRFSTIFRVSTDTFTLSNSLNTLSIEGQISGLLQTSVAKNETHNTSALKIDYSMELFESNDIVINKDIASILNVTVGDSINFTDYNDELHALNVVSIYDETITYENTTQNSYNNSLYYYSFNNLVFVSDEFFSKVTPTKFKGYVTFGKELRFINACYKELFPLLKTNNAVLSIPNSPTNNVYVVNGLLLSKYDDYLYTIYLANFKKINDFLLVFINLVLLIVIFFFMNKFIKTYFDTFIFKEKYFSIFIFLYYLFCVVIGSAIILIGNNMFTNSTIDGSVFIRSNRFALQLLSIYTILYIVIFFILFMSKKAIYKTLRTYNESQLTLDDLVEKKAFVDTSNKPMLTAMPFESISPYRDIILMFGLFTSPCQSAGACRSFYFGKLFAKANYTFVLSSYMNDVDAGTLLKQDDNLYFLPFTSTPNSFKDRTRKYFSNKKYIKQTLNKFKTRKPKIIIIYSALPVGSVRYIKKYCKKNNIKLVFDVVESQVITQQNIKTFFSYYLPQHTINNHLITRKQSVIAISSYLNDFYVKKGIKSILVPFISDTSSTPDYTRINDFMKKRRNATYILYAGNPFKKRDLLAPIFSAISKLDEVDKNKLVFIVAGVKAEQLLKLEGVKSKDLLETNNNIAVIGRVDHYTIENLYSLCDYTILVKPEKARFSKAGFPTKVSESLAHGVPPVTNISSDLETYLNNENSIIIKNDSEDAIKDALVRAIRLSKQDKEKMRLNARNTSQNLLDIQTYVKPLTQFIKD